MIYNDDLYNSCSNSWSRPIRVGGNIYLILFVKGAFLNHDKDEGHGKLGLHIVGQNGKNMDRYCAPRLLFINSQTAQYML
jgi:hypothetical protein